MRLISFFITITFVIGLAYWAYQENYKTKKILEEIADVKSQITAAKSRRAILQAEWAYLNRPSRLRELAELNFDTLSLLPFRAEQFGTVEQIAYPPEPLVIIQDSVDVAKRGAGE